MALKDWVPQVRKALDQAVTDHIVLTQSKLAQANPKDSGRMASSWFIGKDKPDLSVRPENKSPRNSLKNICLDGLNRQRNNP